MRIGIDARTLFAPTLRGIGKYLYNLLDNLAELNKENSYILYYEDGFKNKRLLEYSNFLEKCITISKGSRLYLWEQLRLPISVKLSDFDVFHSPGNTAMLFQPCPTIVTVHDTILQELIKGDDILQRFYINNLQPYVWRKSYKIIAPSLYTKRRIIDLFKVAEEKIEIIYQGINKEFKIIEDKDIIERVKIKYKIKSDYIFALGAESEWKNTRRLLKAYADLKYHIDMRELLVISGIQKYALESFKKEISQLGIEDRVVLLGYISESELVALYNGAKLFVYPTLFEGFGFPPLESMACGVPVVASDATSIPEIVGDAAFLVDATDIKQLAEGIITLINNKELRNKFREKGLERVKNFSWRNTAKETLQLYEEAAINNKANAEKNV